MITLLCLWYRGLYSLKTYAWAITGNNLRICILMNNYLETITLQPLCGILGCLQPLLGCLQPLLGCLIELSSCLYTRQGIVVLSTESGDILLTMFLKPA